MYKLSQRSLDRLEGLDERLIAVVTSAIHHSKIDFGVICGMRTLEEQRALVEKGIKASCWASQNFAINVG